MILVVDNYDSFTFNLVQYLGELGAEVWVERNDSVTPAQIAERAPSAIVLSPGPKSPAETEPTNEIVRRFAGSVPMLGVCLGHQCVAHVFGASVVRAERLMHGKTSAVLHHGTDLFRGIPSPFAATRYHSLLVDRASLPADLLVTAWTAEGEVMGLRHREFPLWGVQFHPESILTEEGRTLLANFLALAGEGNPGLDPARPAVGS